jgi:hypothetical protein
MIVGCNPQLDDGSATTLQSFRFDQLCSRAGALVTDSFLRLHNHLGEAIITVFLNHFLALLVGLVWKR